MPGQSFVTSYLPLKNLEKMTGPLHNHMSQNNNHMGQNHNHMGQNHNHMGQNHSHIAQGQNDTHMGHNHSNIGHNHNRGLVAVVRGLQDAGLAVTLTDERQLDDVVRQYGRNHAERRNLDKSLIPKSSSFTQTGHAQRALAHRLSSHSTRDRFLTTYQDAHRMSQSYSAPLHTDVSTSRNDSFSAPNCLDPYRVNFDSFAPVRDTTVSRPADRSSPLTPVSNRGSFAASLRKYPGPPPERTTSADLIHKLLSHTTNITKSSHHSKSLRSLKNTQDQPKDSKIPKKASKNVQTYTRNHYDLPYDYQGRVEVEERAGKLRIEENGPGCSRAKEDDYYYDYLKPYCVARFDTTSGYGHHGTPGSSPTRSRSRSRHSTINIDSPRTSKSRTDATRVPNMSNKSVRRYTSDKSPKASPSRTERINLRSSPRRSDLTSPNRRGKDDPAGLILDRNPKTSQTRTEGTKMYIRTEGSPRNSPPRWNKPEVRYLNDVTKYVRDAIRQIYEEQPQTCPRMSSRYSQHRREFHRNGPASGADWASIESQTSPRQSHMTSHTCPNSPTISVKTSPIRKSCLICHKPLPCGCSKSRKIKFRSPNVCNTRNEYDSDEEITDRDYVNRKIEDVIFDWLQDIPVYASYSPGDRCQRDRVTHSLIDGIIRSYGSDNFEKIARDEILLCLTQLPMWYPNKKDKNEFRNEQTEKLIRKLRNVKSKRDKFGEAIAKWFRELSFKTTHDGKAVNKRAILKDITQKLRRVALKKHATLEEYYNCLKEKAYEIIEQLPLEVEGNRMRVNQKLNDHLMDRLAMIPAIDVKKKLDYDPENEFEWEVLDWVEDLPEFADLSETEGRNALKKLAKKLKDLRAQNLNYDEVHDEMETAINDWVEYLQERLPVDVENDFQKDIFDWIEKIPEIASESPEEKSANEASAKVLAETLNRMQKEGFENDAIQDQMLTAIKDALTSYLQRKGKRMDIKNKHRLAEQLLDKLGNTVEKGKRKRQVPRLVKKKAQKWLHELSDLALSTPEERQELDRLAQILANDINEIRKNGINDNTQNEMLEKIQAIYETALTKKGAQFTPKQKKKASDVLLKKILNLLKNVEDPMPTKKIEDDLQRLMADLLEDVHFLDTTDESDKKELERIANEIAKNLAVKATEGIYDVHVHQEMLEEIKFNLDQALEKNHPDMSIDDNVKNETAEKILAKVLVAINKAERTHNLPEQYQKKITSFLENIADLNKTPADKIENEKLTQALTRKLIDLQAKGVDDELIKDQMKEEIENRMRQTLDKRGVHMSPKIAKKYYDNLLNQLVNETKNAAKPQIATEEMENEFEKEIGYFIEDIPQWSRDTPEHKSANSKVSKYLAKNLNLLQHEGTDKEEIKDAMLKEINSHLDLGAEQRKQNVIDPHDKDVLAKQLLDNIITKADQLQRKHNLPDVMLKDICKWMESISTLASVNPAEKKLDEIAARTLTNQLIKYLDKDMHDEEVQEQINTQINRFLETLLNRKGEHLNTKTKQKLARELFEKIWYAMKYYRKIQVPTNKMMTEVQRGISEWIPENLKETATDQKEAENMVRRLTKNLIDLQTRGVHNDEVQQKMLDDIKDELDIAYERKGEQIDSSQKKYLAEKLFDKVVTTADKVDKKSNLLDAITRDVINWVEDIPELASSNVSEKNTTEQWARSLAKNLQSIKRNSLDEKDEQNQMMKEIKMNLDLILEKKGQQMNPSQKIKICEKLVGKVMKQKKQAENISVPTKAIENEFKEDIETWMYDIPAILAGKQREEFVEKLAKDLNKIHADVIQDEKVQKRMLDKVEADLEETLTKYGGDISQDEQHELAKNLVSSLCLTGVSTSKKQNLTDDLEKNISDWVEDIPELASVKPSDKRDNQQMSRKLANKLQDLHTKVVAEESLREQMMKEIKNELNSSLEKKGESMPLTAKNKIAQKLFADLSITVDRSASIDVSPDKVEKAFRSEIAEWVNEIPELVSNKSSTEKKQNDEFSNKLSQKLAQYQKYGLKQKNKDEMLEEIKNDLDTVLATKGATISTNEKNKLAENLMMNLIGTAESEKEKAGIKHVDDKVKRDVKNWIENIPELDPASNENKQELSKKLKDTIKNYEQADLDDLQVRETAINELKTHLDSSLGKKKLDEKMKTALANQLLDQTVSKYGKLRGLKNVFYKTIVEWFESIPETKSESPTEKKQVENVSRALASNLKPLQAKDIEREETRCQMLGEIKDHLEHLLDIKGNQIDTVRKTILCEEIFDKLIQDVKRSKLMKTQSLDETAQNELKNELTEWMLQNPDLPFDKSDIKDLEQINVKLIAKMNKMHSDGVPFGTIKTRIVSDITKELDALCEKKGKTIDPKCKQKIAENMFDIMTRSMKNKQRASKTGMIKPEAELQDTQRNITKYILNNPDLPFDNTDIESIDNMSKNLAKKMNELKARGYSDEQIEEIMMNEMENEFDGLCKAKGSNVITLDPKIKNELRRDLFNNMAKSAKDKEKQKMKPQSYDVVSYLLNDIPGLQEKTPEEREEIAQALALKYQELKDLGLTEEEILKEMAEEVDTQLANKGIKLSEKDKNKLIGNLTDTLENSENNMVISGLMDDIPGLKAKTPQEKKENDEMAKELANKYQELKDLGLTDEEIQKEMAKELDKRLADRGINLSAKDKNKLIGNVIEKIDKTSSDKPVSSLLDNVPGFKAITLQEKKRNDEMALALADKYQELQDLGLTDEAIQKEMAKELDKRLADRGINLSAKDKNKLIGNVIEKIDKTSSDKPVSSLLDNIPGLKAKTHQEKKRNDEMALALAAKYQELQYSDLTEEEIKKEMSKELDYQLADRGVTLSAKDKNNFLEHDMHNVVISWLTGLPGFSKNVERWFKGINELSGVTKNQTDELANKLQKIKGSNLNAKSQQKQMQNEIGGWLDDIARKNNIQLKDSAKDNHINKLVKEVGDVGVDENKISNPIETRSEFKGKMTAQSQSPGEFTGKSTSSRSRSPVEFNDKTITARSQSQGEFNDKMTSSRSQAPGKFKGNITSSRSQSPGELKANITSSRLRSPGEFKSNSTSARSQSPGEFKDDITSSRSRSPGEFKSNSTSSKSQSPGELKANITSLRLRSPGEFKSNSTSARSQSPGELKDDITSSRSRSPREFKDNSTSARSQSPGEFKANITSSRSSDDFKGNSTSARYQAPDEFKGNNTSSRSRSPGEFKDNSTSARSQSPVEFKGNIASSRSRSPGEFKGNSTSSKSQSPGELKANITSLRLRSPGEFKSNSTSARSQSPGELKDDITSSRSRSRSPREFKDNSISARSQSPGEFKANITSSRSPDDFKGNSTSARYQAPDEFKGNNTSSRSRSPGEFKDNSTSARSQSPVEFKGNIASSRSRSPGEFKGNSTYVKSQSPGEFKGNSTSSQSRSSGEFKGNSTSSRSPGEFNDKNKTTYAQSRSPGEFKAKSTSSRSRSPRKSDIYMPEFDSDRGTSHLDSSSHNQSKSGKLSTSKKIPGSRTATQRPASRIEKTQSPTDLYYVEEASSPSRRKSSRKDSINLDETLTELNKNLDDLTQKKITAAIANNLDVLDTPNIGKLKNQLVDILKDAKFTDEEARIMSKNIIQAARKGNTGSLQPRRESDVMGSINNIVLNVLDSFNVTQRRPSIENNVASYITPLIMECENVDKVGVQQFMKASGLPDDKISEIADKIVQEVNMIPLSEKQKAPWTPMDKDNFKEKAAVEMMNFIAGITGDLSLEDKVNVQEAVERAIAKIADILADPSLSEDEKQSLIREELLKELQGLPIDSDIPLEELANQLMGILIDVGDGARYSTPKGSWDESMAMQREEDYLNKVAEAINDWAETLPIDPVILNDESFRETISKDLAGDIVDRQKYLQLHPEAKKTTADEIEHMKYQVYRWLNKFLDPKDLNKTVLKVPTLMDALKKIEVPQLVRPTKRRRSRLAKGQIPTFLDALEDEISMWMDEQPPNLFTSDGEEVKQQMVKSLAMNVQAHKGRCTAEENIRNDIIDWLPRTFNNASSAELNRMQEELQRLFRKKGFTDDSWAPSMDTSQFIDENSSSIFEDWLRKVPFYQKRNTHERREQEMLMAELAKALKSIVDNSDGEGLEEQLVDETARRLKDMVMDQELKNDETYLRKIAEQIFDYLKKHQMSYQGCCSTLPPDRTLEDVVDDWVVGIQTCNRSCQQKHQLETKKREVISCLKGLRQKHDVSSCQHEPALKCVIDNFLRSVVDPCKKYDETYITEKINELLRHLRSVPVDLDGSIAVYAPKVFKKPTDVLFEDVEKWCKDLPIYIGDDDDDDQERVQTLKHNLACKIVNKLGELNMNPEIFNDEFLYEDLLTDEIDKILEDLPRNPELDKYLPALKMDLIFKIKEGRQRLRDDLAGKAYKQLLRDTITSSVCLSESLSSEEEASFEILKDNLADAYINLHYVSDNDDERNRFKKKINEELTRFCTKFLRRHPSSPIDPSRINRDLYFALRRIPVPRDESMRSEVEQSRVKDVINDWLKDLRLKEECGTGLLHRNKMATVLAKRIQELEREKESNPLMDCEHKIVEEATKFLRKLSLGSQEYRIPEWSEMLKCRLKCSEKTRKFDVSRPCYAHSQTNSVCVGPAPCGLSNEDRAHLQRIKDRYGKSLPYLKDAYVCPPPQDASSQASIRCWDQPHPLQRRGELRNNACQTKLHTHSQHSYGKRDNCSMTPNHTPSQSGYEISPRVIVKEYLWDSANTSKMQSCAPSCDIHPSTCIGHAPPISCGSYPPPCNRPNQPCSSCVGVQQGQSYTQQKPSCSNENQNNQKCNCTATKSEESICPRQSSAKNRHRYPDPEDSSEEQEDRSCRRPHVTNLGSFDSDRSCGTNKKKSKKKDKGRRMEDSGWSDHEQDEDASFWGSRHKMCDSPSEHDSFVRHKEKRQETLKCKCRDRVMMTCKGKPNQGRMVKDTCTTCSKCPHPSYLFFK